MDWILDEAEQKGTGRWAAQSALELGVPAPTLTAAVIVRTLSSFKADRKRISALLPLAGADSGDTFGETPGRPGGRAEPGRPGGFLPRALVAIRGLAPVRVWDRPGGSSAGLAGGLLYSDPLAALPGGNGPGGPGSPPPALSSPVSGPGPGAVGRGGSGPAMGAMGGHPDACAGECAGVLPAMGRARLPANLIQALRDAFGAHTYRRIDRPGVFHTEWET